jgi:hypothetical protein
MINPTKIQEVYSGRPGCGCGCQGTYYQDKKNINRIVKLMNARKDEIKFEHDIYSIENDVRYFWAYPKKSEVSQ